MATSAKYKMFLFGGGGVGKSALITKFLYNYFETEYDPTIENSYYKEMIVEGKPLKLDICDTAGQEEYATMSQAYMKKGDGFILAYSVNSEISFHEVQDKYNQILVMKDTDKVPVVLVGNKADLEEEREVTHEEGKALAEKWDVPFFELSAKDDNGDTVAKPFIALTSMLNSKDDIIAEELAATGKKKRKKKLFFKKKRKRRKEPTEDADSKTEKTEKREQRRQRKLERKESRKMKKMKSKKRDTKNESNTIPEQTENEADHMPVDSTQPVTNTPDEIYQFVPPDDPEEIIPEENPETGNLEEGNPETVVETQTELEVEPELILEDETIDTPEVSPETTQNPETGSPEEDNVETIDETQTETELIPEMDNVTSEIIEAAEPEPKPKPEAEANEVNIPQSSAEPQENVESPVSEDTLIQPVNTNELGTEPETNEVNPESETVNEASPELEVTSHPNADPSVNQTITPTPQVHEFSLFSNINGIVDSVASIEDSPIASISLYSQILKLLKAQLSPFKKNLFSSVVGAIELERMENSYFRIIMVTWSVIEYLRSIPAQGSTDPSIATVVNNLEESRNVFLEELEVISESIPGNSWMSELLELSALGEDPNPLQGCQLTTESLHILLAQYPLSLDVWTEIYANIGDSYSKAVVDLLSDHFPNAKRVITPPGNFEGDIATLEREWDRLAMLEIEIHDHRLETLRAWNDFKRTYLVQLHELQNQIHSTGENLLGNLEKVIPYHTVIDKYTEYNTRPELVAFTFLTYLARDDERTNLKKFSLKIQELKGRSCGYILSETMETIEYDLRTQLQSECSLEALQFIISMFQERFDEYKIFLQNCLSSKVEKEAANENLKNNILPEDDTLVKTNSKKVKKEKKLKKEKTKKKK